ncbi:MAG: NUDIX hydrolase [Fusobacteriaceae bacterium]
MKILMVKKSNDHKLWGPPGGRVEFGESLTDASKRELYEETGITDFKIYETCSSWSGKNGTDFLHVLQIAGETDISESEVVLSDENSDWMWWNFGNFFDIELQTYVNKDYMLKGWFAKSGSSFPLIICDKKDSILIKNLIEGKELFCSDKKNRDFYTDKKIKILLSDNNEEFFNVKIEFSEEDSAVSSYKEYLKKRTEIDISFNKIFISSNIEIIEKKKIFNQILEDFSIKELD